MFKGSWVSWARRAWIPRDVPGVAVGGAYYEADQGITTSGANITGWADLSGNGKNLIVGAASPTLVANAYKGRPTARFVSASTQSMQRASTNLFGSGAWFMCIAVKPNNGANNIGVASCSSASGGGGFFMNGVHRTVIHPAVAAYDDGDPAGAIEVWTAVRAAGAKPLFYLNGVLTSVSGAATTMNDGGGTSAIGVGITPGFAATFDGDIPAAVFGVGALDTGTQKRLENYLGTKYV